MKNNLKQYFIQYQQLFGNRLFLKTKKTKLKPAFFCKPILGSKSPKFIFLKCFSNNELTEVESNLLNKILKALNLSFEQISILEVYSQKKDDFLNFDSYKNSINPDKIIVLGLDAAQVMFESIINFKNLKNKFNKYQYTDLIITYSLKDIINDLSLKKQVWNDIKVIGS